MKHKLFLIFFLSFIIYHLSFPQAFASSESIRVAPVIEELSIAPGKTTTYSLNISNSSAQPIGIHADITNFETSNEDTSTTSYSSPLISWTSVSPSDIIIPSNETKSINVTILPPSEIKKGGYYAGIFLTPFVDKEKVPNAPIILTRIGTLILAQYGETDYANLKEKAQIKNFSFNKLIFENSPFDFHFTVTNSYFTHFNAKPFITVATLFGKSEMLAVSEKNILPGKSKTWNESITSKLFSPIYIVHLAVSVGGGNFITSDSYIVVIPGLHIILIAIILLMLAAVATYHKRFRKALSILLTGKG